MVVHLLDVFFSVDRNAVSSGSSAPSPYRGPLLPKSLQSLAFGSGLSQSLGNVTLPNGLSSFIFQEHFR